MSINRFNTTCCPVSLCVNRKPFSFVLTNIKLYDSFVLTFDEMYLSCHFHFILPPIIIMFNIPCIEICQFFISSFLCFLFWISYNHIDKQILHGLAILKISCLWLLSYSIFFFSFGNSTSLKAMRKRGNLCHIFPTLK